MTRRNFVKMFDAGKTRMIGLPYGEKNYDDMLSRFRLIPERYGPPDGRTHLLYQYRASACVSINPHLAIITPLCFIIKRSHGLACHHCLSDVTDAAIVLTVYIHPLQLHWQRQCRHLTRIGIHMTTASSLLAWPQKSAELLLLLCHVVMDVQHPAADERWW